MIGFRAVGRVRLLMLWAILSTVASAAWAEDVGTVAAVDGTAEIGRDGVWTAAVSGAPVAVGDSLRTGQPGGLRVVFRDDSVITLADSCTLVVDDQVFDSGAGGAQSLFGLLRGTVKAVVSNYYGTPGSSYEVKTETAVAGVRGTEFVMSFDPDSGKTDVIGIRGVVTVHSTVDPTGPGLLVTANEITAVSEGELPSHPQAVDPELMRRLLRDIDFFSSSQGLSVTEGSQVIAGAAVPQPAQAPAPSAALVTGPQGPPVGIDAGGALGNSLAAIIGGSGSGSINVNPGRR